MYPVPVYLSLLLNQKNINLSLVYITIQQYSRKWNRITTPFLCYIHKTVQCTYLVQYINEYIVRTIAEENESTAGYRVSEASRRIFPCVLRN